MYSSQARSIRILRDNEPYFTDISGIFQGYLRAKSTLWGLMYKYTVNRGYFGENWAKYHLITSKLGYFLPGMSMY